jgi:hypothetical protein
MLLLKKKIYVITRKWMEMEDFLKISAGHTGGQDKDPT